MKQLLLNLVEKAHTFFISERRRKALSSSIADLLPEKGKILDIGCGDGAIDADILEKKQGLSIVGVDIYKPSSPRIKVGVFDGRRVPFPDKSFDCVLLIDTLHHTENPKALLGEAVRVTKRCLIVKDHYAQTPIANHVLKFMDWVGNRPYGVVLTYKYLSSSQWEKVWTPLGLKVVELITQINLHPFPASLIFDRGKHFIAKLETSDYGE